MSSDDLINLSDDFEVVQHDRDIKHRCASSGDDDLLQLDDLAHLDALQPALLPTIAQDKSSRGKSSANGQLVDLSSTSSVTRTGTGCNIMETILEEPELTMWSDGEESPATLTAKSASKVLPWNDGRIMPKRKQRVQQENVDDTSLLGVSASNTDFLSGRTPNRAEAVPSSSLPSLKPRTGVEPQQHLHTKKSFAEAVTRTYNPITDTVKVSAIRQKRKANEISDRTTILHLSCST